MAEWVVNHPMRGYPKRREGGKYLVWGQTQSGHYVQVLYVFDPPGIVYVIHARPLTENEKRRAKRGAA